MFSSRRSADSFSRRPPLPTMRPAVHGGDEVAPRARDEDAERDAARVAPVRAEVLPELDVLLHERDAPLRALLGREPRLPGLEPRHARLPPHVRADVDELGLAVVELRLLLVRRLLGADAVLVQDLHLALAVGDLAEALLHLDLEVALQLRLREALHAAVDHGGIDVGRLDAGDAVDLRADFQDALLLVRHGPRQRGPVREALELVRLGLLDLLFQLLEAVLELGALALVLGHGLLHLRLLGELLGRLVDHGEHSSGPDDGLGRGPAPLGELLRGLVAHGDVLLHLVGLREVGLEPRDVVALVLALQEALVEVRVHEVALDGLGALELLDEELAHGRRQRRHLVDLLRVALLAGLVLRADFDVDVVRLAPEVPQLELALGAADPQIDDGLDLVLLVRRVAALGLRLRRHRAARALRVVLLELRDPLVVRQVAHLDVVDQVVDDLGAAVAERRRPAELERVRRRRARVEVERLARRHGLLRRVGHEGLAALAPADGILAAHGELRVLRRRAELRERVAVLGDLRAKSSTRLSM
mmetsp:Transcript_9772/g.33574  ORF Transcript_9772/g.33574 Transcript_9772/m.33574 type:complete len:532 (+) Transcript_9772:349-1944(+)